MTDYFSSLFDNVKQKTTNPLLGTIIFVIIFRYWDIIYAVFTFDDDCDMLYKLTYIQNYFAKKVFLKEIGIIVFQAFCILIATYLLLTLSRFILNVYQKHLLSRTDGFTDKRSVKTIKEYESLKKEYDGIVQELKNSNEFFNKQEVNILSYKNKLFDYQNRIEEQEKTNSDYKNQVDNLRTEIVNEREKSANSIKELQDINGKIRLELISEKDKVDELRNISKFSDSEFISIDKLNNEVPTRIKELYQILKSEDYIEIFKQLVVDKNYNEEFSIGMNIPKNTIDYFRNIGVLKIIRSDEVSSVGLLTEKGRMLILYINKIDKLFE